MDSREVQRRLRELNRRAGTGRQAVKPVRQPALPEPTMRCDLCGQLKPLARAYVYHDEWNSRDEHICGDCRSAEEIAPGSTRPYLAHGRFETDNVTTRTYSSRFVHLSDEKPRMPSDVIRPGWDVWLETDYGRRK